MNTVFLIGAGFNADAVTEAGPVYGESIYIGKHQIACEYPLLADIPRICFESNSLITGESVEELLVKALNAREFEPVKRLAKEIMKADYYLIPRLNRAGSRNCYERFFDRFATAQFLTFNYDSLVELFLLRLGNWVPDDGYGVPVQAHRQDGATKGVNSRSLVLHLHGTFCLYIQDHQFVDRTGNEIEWYEEVNPPRFIFDPDSISSWFSPYIRKPPSEGWKLVQHRVIAPIPDKTTGLQGKFVQRMYDRARELLESADVLIAIGYGFGAADRESYESLLKALQRAKAPRLVIVDPAAN